MNNKNSVINGIKFNYYMSDIVLIKNKVFKCCNYSSCATTGLNTLDLGNRRLELLIIHYGLFKYVSSIDLAKLSMLVAGIQ